MNGEEFQEAGANVAIGLDPLMGKSFGTLIKDIPKRMVALLSKLISYKTAILIGCGYLMTKGYLESWAFLALVVVVLFERGGLKFLKDLRR